MTSPKRNADYVNADAAYSGVLAQLLDQGKLVQTTHLGKLDTKGSLEILGHNFVMNNPLDRIVFNRERHFSIIEAAARLVFFAAGSNRLSDMAFYQPAVRRFSDDGYSLPGSNYGMRILQPRPGLNQIDGVVRTLKEEQGSRRAATVVWSPDDAVRNSSDIPCAFGTSYFLRDGKVNAITMMRSNNAVLLLPYNIFEFSLLGELVARKVNAEVGSYTHFSCSMHLYEDDLEKARKSIEVASATPIAMSPMPAEPDPWEQLKELVKLEAGLRNDNVMSRRHSHYDLIETAKKTLHEYWLTFYKVLVIHCLTRLSEFDEAATIARKLPPYFGELVMSEVQWKRDAVKDEPVMHTATLDAFTKSESNQGAIFGSPSDPRLERESENIAKAYALQGDDETRILGILKSFKSRLEARGEKIQKLEFKALFSEMIAEAAILATRSVDPKKYFSDEEIKGKLNKIRQKK